MSEPKRDELTEWPCQDLHGGKMPFLNTDANGMCKHPECHPDNDDRKPKRDRAREIYRKWLRNGSRFYENDCIKMLREMEQSTLRRAVEVDPIETPPMGVTYLEMFMFKEGMAMGVIMKNSAIRAMLEEGG